MSNIGAWTTFFNGLLPNVPVAQQYAKVFAENDLDPRVGDMIDLEMLESLGHRLMIKKALAGLAERNPLAISHLVAPYKSSDASDVPAASPPSSIPSHVVSSSPSPPVLRAGSTTSASSASSAASSPRSHRDRKEEKKHKKEKQDKKDDKEKGIEREPSQKQEKAVHIQDKPVTITDTLKPKEKKDSNPAAPLQKEKSSVSENSDELDARSASNSSGTSSKYFSEGPDAPGHMAVPRLARLCIRLFREEKIARHAYKAGDFHRLLVLFKQELPLVLARTGDKKVDPQAITDVLALNLPANARRPSKNDIRVQVSTQRARLRIKAFGGALSGCFLYQPMRENMIVDLGVETILRSAQMGILKVHKELSWHHTFAITKKDRIGVGATAVVYRMEMPGKGEIALKVFSDKDQDAFQTCRTELAFASICSHPNLVNTHGGCTSNIGSYCLAMEFCGRGTLYELLRDAELTLNWPLRLQIARGVAMGLSYVHSVKIIHRDVKSLNILITRDMVAKLTDFGASTIMAPTNTQGIGSIMWMAPEVLQSKQYSEKADIYSFGIVMWEIFERDLPYPNMRSYQIEKYVLEKKRPPISPMCPRQYVDLMQALWDPKPDKRPSAADAAASCEALMRSPWVSAPLSASELELQQAGSKGFNVAERQLILDSWQLLSDRHQQLITLFYARFFELLPEVRKMFDHVSNDRMSRKIARTITAVLSGLSTESLKETDAAKAHKELYALGQRHVRYGAKPEYVPAFKEAFMYSLGHESMLGNHFTTPMRLAWAKGLKLAADVVGAGLLGKPEKPCRIQ